MTSPTTPTKIVIVAGQEFSVPADTDNEAIRKQLASMGFADVAAATIQTGSREVAGAQVTTVEFVKKAGTKGVRPVDLVDLIAQVQAAPPPRTVVYGPDREQAVLLGQLAQGQLTIAEALARVDSIRDALVTLERPTDYREHEGSALCRRLSPIAAAAANDVSGW